MSNPTENVVFDVDGVSKDFGHRGGFIRGQSTLVHAVDGVDVHIREGEAFGLVGESGSGKSTLGRLLVGFEKPNEGSISFRGEPLHSFDRDRWFDFRSRVQMIFQNTASSLNPRRKMRDSLSAGIRAHKMTPPDEVDDRLVDLVESVGLHRSMLNRYPHQFSGGQRQRMVVARALSVDPEVLLADEAVSALDVSVQAQVLNLLKDLQDERQLTTVFIAHDLRVVNFFSDRFGVMYLGRLVEVGERKTLITRSRHPYTRMLLTAAPGQAASRTGAGQNRIVRGEIGSTDASDETLRAGCVFSRRCWLREQLGWPEKCETEIPPLYVIDPAGHRAACHYTDDIDAAFEDADAEVSNLT